ncbi:MAG: pilus assembly protein PilM, partial [Spirochaetes bacterium]|nr:pilus assembly protein PilM [Spirochaetota bacterium]
LKRFAGETDLKDCSILINLPMEKVIIRDLTFPFAEIKKIEEAIRFEAEENIPFPIDQVIIDFQQVQSTEAGEGKVLLAAARKDEIGKVLEYLEECGLKPVLMGLESQAIYQCYKYFNKIENEAVIQIHTGNYKTIVNIIQNNNLLFTRSIPIGTGLIYRKISESLKITVAEAAALFENLNLDLHSFENNLQKDDYKSNKITRSALKNIFNISTEVINELIEQVLLTQKAFLLSCEIPEFSRILISGGGANIQGIGTLISNEFELPVVAQPFIEDNREPGIQTQFPIAFGTVLTYLDSTRKKINFLKDEFLPETASSRKKYYLAAAFGIMTLFILIINIISTSYLRSQSESKYADILNDRLKKYFHTRKTNGDPVKEAQKIVSEQKKELETIEALVHADKKIIDVLRDILSFLQKGENFTLKNLVINETIIQINGLTASSRNIDEFKNKLINSKMFDNVTLNTNIKKDAVNFSMTIKLKISDKVLKAREKASI